MVELLFSLKLEFEMPLLAYVYNVHVFAWPVSSVSIWDLSTYLACGFLTYLPLDDLALASLASCSLNAVELPRIVYFVRGN